MHYRLPLVAIGVGYGVEVTREIGGWRTHGNELHSTHPDRLRSRGAALDDNLLYQESKSQQVLERRLNMDYLPIFMNLRAQRCLVVGGGAVAARKAALLYQAGARLRVIAPRLSSAMRELLREASSAELLRTPFNPQHLQDCRLAVAATNQPEVNQRVHACAVARGIPVNVVDQPDLCSFIFPAIVDRTPLIIAVSSGGAAPVLTRLLRARLESSIPAAYGGLAKLASGFREVVKNRLRSVGARRLFWERVLEGPPAEAALSGCWDEARVLLERELDGADGLPCGEVYLIGAGPGDPDLLTFKALRLLQKADVVVYDRLVPQAIVDLARREAERIYVGKRRNVHSLPQPEISRLLAKLATQGRKVARLKGGDPFIFGRGGEEIEMLAHAGIPFQVVPGITAASGCAAYAGIPLTHRDHAGSVRFIAGHTRDGQLDLDWAGLARSRETLVFYMGLTNLETICVQLIAYGLAADTPAALIERGTTPQQRVHVATLADLPMRVVAMGAVSPALLIVGQVVRLHASLNWFGDDQRMPIDFPARTRTRAGSAR